MEDIPDYYQKIFDGAFVFLSLLGGYFVKQNDKKIEQIEAHGVHSRNELKSDLNARINDLAMGVFNVQKDQATFAAEIARNMFTRNDSEKLEEKLNNVVERNRQEYQQSIRDVHDKLDKIISSISRI